MAGKKNKKKECGRRSKKKIPKKNTYTLKTLNIREAKKKGRCLKTKNEKKKKKKKPIYLLSRALTTQRKKERKKEKDDDDDFDDDDLAEENAQWCGAWGVSASVHRKG